MHNKINYQKKLDALLAALIAKEQRPSLLLHSCCAPCSTYVLEYLHAYFDITVFYYNPNIYPREEYNLRLAEEKRFIAEYPTKRPIRILEGDYEPRVFSKAVAGLEQEPEGGARCPACYKLRLEKTARLAAENGFDYFCTTLSVSPYKNAAHINAIGSALGQRYGVPFLCSDFKKRDGYKRSIALSSAYQLYRQDYCGCEFSLQARNKEEST